MILQEIGKILEFIGRNYLRIWPVILITLPLSISIHLSGAGSKIKGIMMKNPVVSVFLATLVGALSPLCSCTIIPVIASMLIAGVPLAPVMSFWVASPSMDPEIFFLSAAQLNMGLAIWRLVATFLLSLSAGYITLLLEKRGFFKADFLKERFIFQKESFLSKLWNNIRRRAGFGKEMVPSRSDRSCCAKKSFSNNTSDNQTFTLPENIALEKRSTACCQPTATAENSTEQSCCSSRESKPASSCGCSSSDEQVVLLNTKKSKGPFTFFKNPANRKKLRQESLRSIGMILQFMTLAFFLEAIITYYMPVSWIEPLLGQNNFIAILLASIIGVPLYTSGLAALGIVSGLMTKGMISSAALAFLIAGPVTTIPAMSAVYGIVKPRVFLLYLSFAFGGALFFGTLYFLLPV